MSGQIRSEDAAMSRKHRHDIVPELPIKPHRMEEQDGLPGTASAVANGAA
jgi:hypothetical protein